MLIFSESITYLKNREKIFTQGNTEAIIDQKYNFKSKDTELFRNKIIKVISQIRVEDDNDKFIIR